MPTSLSKPDSFADVFTRKPGEQQRTTHYCPGCGHGILHKLLAEAVSDFGAQDRTVMIAPVGCAVFLYYYFECGGISVPHGRAPAVGTGIARALDDAVVVCYQGDGDLAAIGTNNTIHAANRGERLLVVFVNNAVYGMTGGQMAPTTLIDQKTVTTPRGRSVANEGYPIRMAEIIATLDAPLLVARSAVNSPRNVRQTRKLLRRGIQAQMERKGYVFLEVLSPCPTNWRMSAPDACEWIDSVMSEQYPLGVFKDVLEQSEPRPASPEKAGFDDVARMLGLTEDTGIRDSGSELPFPQVFFRSAGFGGQGVLSLGLMVANAAMRRGLEVTWLPSYGPEMRGGVANSSVVISRRPIGAPSFERPNLLVAMNKPSCHRFGPLVPADGIVLFNASLVDQVPDDVRATTYGVEATRIAQEVGENRAANTVMLGFLSRVTGMFARPELEAELRRTFTKPAVCEVNLRALDLGWREAEGHSFGAATERREKA